MERLYRGATFRAIDRLGGEYSLTPLYLATSDSDAPPARTWAAADCVRVLAGDGREGERVGTGRYRLFRFAAEGSCTELFSSDVGAP